MKAEVTAAFKVINDAKGIFKKGGKDKTAANQAFLTALETLEKTVKSRSGATATEKSTVMEALDGALKAYQQYLMKAPLEKRIKRERELNDADHGVDLSRYRPSK